MNVIPDVITQIYDPRRGPFRNLCALAAAEALLDAIRAEGHLEAVS